MNIDHIEEVNKSIDTIEHVEKANPYHGKDGRFTSANGVGGAAVSVAGAGVAGSGDVLDNLKDFSNKDKVGKKVKTINGGGTVTIGNQAAYDSFGSDKIKRGNEYAVVSVMRGTVRVGTYNGTKSYSTGGRYEFTGRDGKGFSVEFDNVGMNPIYEAK